MADNEPVTSPDQHKPQNLALARVGGLFTIGVLVLMTVCGNHHGHVEDWFLIGTAALIAVGIVGDWLLRKNGLRS